MTGPSLGDLDVFLRLGVIEPNERWLKDRVQ